MLIAEGPGNTRGLRISGSGDNRTSRFSISAVVRTLPGASSAAGSIPSWVPRYPNSAPSNIVANQQGPTLRVNFNFSTDDDAQTVIGWYERTLKEAQFTIVSSTVFDAAMATLTAQDPTGRSILTLRMEQAGGRKVVALEAREGVQ
jgi:hypothetical protein